MGLLLELAQFRRLDLTDSRLPPRSHEKSIEPSTRQACKKAPLSDSCCYLVLTRCLSSWKRSVSVSLYPWWCLCLESSGALQAHSSSAYSSSTDEPGGIPRDTLSTEQGVVLSCRFGESKVRWTSRILWVAVVSQSSVKSIRRNSASSSVGANPFLFIMIIIVIPTYTPEKYAWPNHHGYPRIQTSICSLSNTSKQR